MNGLFDFNCNRASQGLWIRKLRDPAPPANVDPFRQLKSNQTLNSEPDS